MADQWGAQNVDLTAFDAYTLCSTNQAQTLPAADAYNESSYVEPLTPVNIDEVLINRARAGIPIHEYQLSLLSKAQQDLLIDEMRTFGAQLIQ